MKQIAMVALMALLAGCTTTDHVRWTGVGGSKADGLVILGVEVPPKIGVRETNVTWDVDQANAEADRRCRNWGYQSAEVFREPFPVQVICHPQGISPCWSKTYRISYQCIDDKIRAQ